MLEKNHGKGNLTHKPFKDLLNKSLDNAPATTNRKEKKRDVQQEFERVLKNRLIRVLPGCTFESKIPGIIKVTLGPTDDENSAPVIVAYNTQNKTVKHPLRVATFSLDNEGCLFGRLPRELRHVEREEILLELLDNLSEVDLIRCIPLTSDGKPVEILPPGDWGLGNKTGKIKEEEKERRNAPIDKERFKIFTRHPKFVAMLGPTKGTRIRYSYDEETGFDTIEASIREYHAFIFPEGVIFENAACENRIYYYPFEPALDLKEIRKLQKNQMSSSELEELLIRIGFHIEREKHKKILRQEGKRFYRNHPSKDSPEHVKESFKKEVWALIDEKLTGDKPTDNKIVDNKPIDNKLVDDKPTGSELVV